MQNVTRMTAFGEGVFSRLAARKQALAKAGRAVYDFSVGAPNIPPAPHVVEALRRACMEPDAFKYAISDTAELLDAAAAWYERRYGVVLNPQTEICSVLGSQEALSHLALTLLNPGDTALVPDPAYPVFADGPRLAEARLYPMPMRREQHYLIQLDEIPETVAREARYMLISYPNNPTCALAPDSFYEEAIDFARKYDILLIHDNAYSELVFGDKRGKSFLSFPGAREVGVELNSLSKTYGLAGARIGFMLGKAEVIERYKRLKSNMDYGMFLPVQKAAVAALSGPQDCVMSTRRAYQRRAEHLCAAFGKLGWEIPMPEGTMFAWAPLPEGFTDSEAFVMRMIEEAGVVLTPGAAFGPLGEGFVRFALVQEEADIDAAAEAIRKSGVLHV